jgi:hypothetical protein
MPHAYPLHVDIDAECCCCRMLQPFRFTSPSDQVVCAFCSRHLGSDKAERRDADHLAQWRERYGEAIEAHRLFVASATAERMAADDTILQLRSRVEDLTKSIADAFDDTTLGGARGLVENEVTRRAERNTELAHRLNDRILGALWRVERLHRDSDRNPLQCTCGKRTQDCAEWKAVDPQRQALRDWERRNLALLREGKRHALPEEHPDVQKDGAGSSRPDRPRRT